MPQHGEYSERTVAKNIPGEEISGRKIIQAKNYPLCSKKNRAKKSPAKNCPGEELSELSEKNFEPRILRRRTFRAKNSPAKNSPAKNSPGTHFWHKSQKNILFYDEI
jgi:hypothetical protein